MVAQGGRRGLGRWSGELGRIGRDVIETRDGERIQAETILSAAGGQGSPLGAALGIPLDKSGRVLVEPDLSIPSHPEVFVIGDLAAVSAPG